MNMKVGWLIDVDIMAEQQVGLIPHLRSLGYEVHKLSVTRDPPMIPYEPGAIWAFLGSFQELRSINDHLDFNVATYGLNRSMARSGYVSHMPDEWFLNNTAVMTTWGQLARRSQWFFDTFHGSLFVRPDSGHKTFTGQVFAYYNINAEMSFIEQHSSVSPDTIVWVSGVKEIDREYRFWISAGRVVTHSEYSWNSNPPDDAPPSQVVCDLARRVAEYEWQVDRIYTVDITEYKGEARIIELNSFSCASLYNCDGQKLLETVSQDILAEWQD